MKKTKSRTERLREHVIDLISADVRSILSEVSISTFMYILWDRGVECTATGGALEKSHLIDLIMKTGSVLSGFLVW